MNPINQTMQISNSLKMAKNLMAQVRSANDPNAMLNYLASQNPKLREVLDMANGNKSPKELFYERANAMGVNPDEIINQLKQI